MGTLGHPCSNPEALSSLWKHLAVCWKVGCRLAFCFYPQVLSQPQNRESARKHLLVTACKSSCALRKLCKGIDQWGLTTWPHLVPRKRPLALVSPAVCSAWPFARWACAQIRCWPRKQSFWEPRGASEKRLTNCQLLCRAVGIKSREDPDQGQI